MSYNTYWLVVYLAWIARINSEEGWQFLVSNAAVSMNQKKKMQGHNNLFGAPNFVIHVMADTAFLVWNSWESKLLEVLFSQHPTSPSHRDFHRLFQCQILVLVMRMNDIFCRNELYSILLCNGTFIPYSVQGTIYDWRYACRKLVLHG